MKIDRGNYSSIQKEKLNVNDFISYDSLNMDLLNSLLNRVISENIYSTFDLMRLLKNNFQGSMKDAIKNIPDYSSVRFNCYYAAKILEEELKKINIFPKYISYKSIGFSSNYGDHLIQEAHMALLIPTLRNGKVYYIILDPGYRIPLCMGFYKDDSFTKICIDHDVITILKTNDEQYPYCMKMEGYNRYSFHSNSYCCEEYFNCNYETLNPDTILFPIAYEILNGYRMINYHEDKRKWAMIKVMIFEKYLECSDYKKHILLPFTELQRFKKAELCILLKNFCDKLHQDVLEFVELLYFMLDYNTQFVDEVVNKRVLKEFYQN